MVVVSRKPEVSREEFLHHWRELHPDFVRKLPGIRGYRQNIAIEHHTAWPFDGIAELRFDTLRDIAVAFDGDAAKALFEHEHHFIGEMKWSIVEEHEIEL